MSDIKKLIHDNDFDDKVIINKIEETIKCYFDDKDSEYKDFYWTLYEKMYGKHFNDALVTKAISEMEFNMPEYKPTLTKEQVKSLIEQAYKVADTNYNKKGKKAPVIHEKVTLCDMLYTYNMIAADYPLTHMGDSSKIALMAYEFLSDPDANECKAYSYYCAMSE